MKLEEQIKEILKEPQKDWQHSFFKHNFILMEYLKLKVHTKEVFKNNSIEWLDKAIINNQENLIFFLSNFTPISTTLLAKSFAYNADETYTHLFNTYEKQQNPDPYKLDFNIMDESKFDYERLKYCIENNQFDRVVQIVDENSFLKYSSSQISVLLQQALSNDKIFNYLISSLEEHHNYLPYETVVNYNAIVQKIIDNELIGHKKIQFFLEISDELNEEIKSNLFYYILKDTTATSEKFFSQNKALIDNSPERLEYFFKHFKFKDSDFYDILEKEMYHFDDEESLYIYSQIKNPVMIQDKNILLIEKNKEKLIEKILTQNEYDFKEFNNEVLKSLAKAESQHFDKMMDFILIKDEAKHLEKILSTNDSEKDKPKKMKI